MFYENWGVKKRHIFIWLVAINVILGLVVLRTQKLVWVMFSRNDDLLFKHIFKHQSLLHFCKTLIFFFLQKSKANVTIYIGDCYYVKGKMFRWPPILKTRSNSKLLHSKNKKIDQSETQLNLYLLHWRDDILQS